MTRHSGMTLDSVADDPASATFSVETPKDAILSPLRSSDEAALVSFFERLSNRTRRFYSVVDCRTKRATAVLQSLDMTNFVSSFGAEV